MDPVSIATSTSALIGCAAKIVKLLHDLYGTLQDAPLLLSSIITECTVVHTSLCVIHDRQSKYAAVTGTSGTRSDQVFNTFDIALSGCALILSVLEKDVQSCLQAGANPQDSGAIKRAKTVLSKDHLQELVSQLRGQQQALTLLLSTLQSQTIDEMRDDVQGNQDLLHGIARVAKRFYVESEYDPSNDDASDAFDQSFEIASVITSTRFAFDAEVLASNRYQRTLEYFHRMETRQAELRNMKTVTDASVDRNSVATSGKKERTSESDNSKSVSTSTSPPESTELHHQQDSGQSSAAIAGHVDTTSTPSSSTFILPEISVGTWDFKAHLLADPAPTKLGPEMSGTVPLDGGVDISPMTSRWMPRESFPNLKLSAKPLYGRDRRTKSVGLELTPVPESPVPYTTEQAPASPNHLSPVSSPAEQLPIKPNIEWLDKIFDITWAQNAVSMFYCSKILTEKEIVFVGDPCVGVTSAIKKAVNGSWMTEYRPTVLDKYSMIVTLNGARFNLKLWDTAGEHLDQLRRLTYNQASLVVICYAIDSPDSLANVREQWIGEVSSLCPAASIILLGCKLDLRNNINTIKDLGEIDQTPVTHGQGLSVARRINAMAYIECSSRAEEGGMIDLLFSAITKCCVLQDQGVGQKRARRQRSLLNFNWRGSKSSLDLTASSLVSTTFTIDTGYLLESRYSVDECISRRHLHRRVQYLDGEIIGPYHRAPQRNTGS